MSAVLWGWSALLPLPLAPGAAFGGTLPTDPFNAVLAQSARLNAWAAGLTAAAVLLAAVERWLRR